MCGARETISNRKTFTRRSVMQGSLIGALVCYLRGDGASLRAAQPDILIMTLGAPVSEEFVARHRAALPPCWVLCAGQAVRVELGLIRRAPSFMRRCGLEWAWRIRQEPQRLGIRYLRALASFPFAVAGDLLWQGHGRRNDKPDNEGQGSPLDQLEP